MGQNILSIYGAIKSLSLVLAATGIAVLGVRYLIGNSQEDSRLFSIGKKLIIALILIWMVGPLIDTGKTIGTKYAWDPEKPGIQDIKATQNANATNNNGSSSGSGNSSGSGSSSGNGKTSSTGSSSSTGKTSSTGSSSSTGKTSKSK